MKLSAGILVYRRVAEPTVEVLLVHPGGPIWASKDAAAWSIPKGEYQPEEAPLAAAVREFGEELGCAVPTGELLALGELRQSSSKWVSAWAVEGDLDTTALRSNTFEMEWPPRSGQLQQFPEVDRAEWFTVELAAVKLHKGQVPFLDRLRAVLA